VLKALSTPLSRTESGALGRFTKACESVALKALSTSLPYTESGAFVFITDSEPKCLEAFAESAFTC